MVSVNWSEYPMWLLRGTRLLLSTILENIEAGVSIDELRDWFDRLDGEQIAVMLESANNLTCRVTGTDVSPPHGDLIWTGNRH